jgi:phosphatidylglycerophosphate synthase
LTSALPKAAETPLAVTVGASGVKVWGMTSQARLGRTYARLGLPEGSLADAPTQGTVLLAHAGWVFDEALIRALAQRPGTVLADDAGIAVAAHGPAAQAVATAKGLESGTLVGERITAIDLIGAYNSALRKREPPVLERLTPQTVGRVEKRLFQGSYKGVTDLVTKYVWPAPARVVTRWCALIGITPNQVTFASLVLVFLAMWLFWTGQFGWGLAAAWVMTFLDTVDGKLARVTLNSSPLGNVFDHGIDLIHPPFWWAAWVVGVQMGPYPLPYVDLILWVVVGGYVIQRMLEGIFLAAFKVEMHAWRPFDSFFRLITARRNPNLILLTLATLAGRPDLGMIAVAAWTALSLLVHAVQVLQAALTPRGAVVSWLSR